MNWVLLIVLVFLSTIFFMIFFTRRLGLKKSGEKWDKDIFIFFLIISFVLSILLVVLTDGNILEGPSTKRRNRISLFK